MWSWLAVVLAGVGWAVGGAEPAVAEVPDGGRYLEPVFDEVEITRDVVYRETADWHGNPVSLRLDVYQPAGDTATERPAILMMSGGFFAYINKDLIFGAGEAYAQMGYVVVSIEYRVRPDGGLENFPDVDPEILEGAALDAYDDGFAAVDWLRDHATELRIDPEAIVPAGGSAGGNVAWNLAWMQGDDPRPAPSGIPAAVSVAGAPGPGTADPGDPPVLAFHGTQDSIIDVSLAAEPCNQADQAGIRCDLVTYDDAGHPLDPQAPDLIALHNEDMIERTAPFIAEVVLDPLGYFDEPAPPHGPRPDEPADPGPRPDDPRPATPVRAQPNFTG